MKKFFETELWGWLRPIVEVLAFGAAILLIVFLLRSIGLAEGLGAPEDGTIPVWTICKPDGIINIRRSPSRRSDETGWLEPGTMVWLDGKEKNGFAHAVRLATEEGEGWISKGYLSDYPVTEEDTDYIVICPGRLAVRDRVNGKRTRWLKHGEEIHVWFRSEEWCVTAAGYVRTEFIERKEQENDQPVLHDLP